VVSLKTHYIHHQHELAQKMCPDIELRLVDTFVLYAIADIMFIVAKVTGMVWILKIGLVYFNIMPLYLVGAHKQRIDAATKRKNESMKKNKTSQGEETKKGK
jgi:hypothetical protein